MKIGKYPVKHTFKVARIVADVLSLGLVVLIVSATVTFFDTYEQFYSFFDTTNSTAFNTLIENDPHYQWKQWLALIFPVLAVIVLIVYVVLLLKNHKLGRYAVTKRNAQRCYDAYAFGVALAKIPALLIVFDMMCIVQDKLLLSVNGFSWFSWLSILSLLLIVITIRYTMRRLTYITARPAEVSSDTVKITAVAVEKTADKKNEDNKEES